MEMKKEYSILMYQVMEFGLDPEDTVAVTDMVFEQLVKDGTTFTEKVNYEFLIKSKIGEYFYNKKMEEDGYRVITVATKDLKSTVPELIKELATLIDNRVDINLNELPEGILESTDMTEEAITNLDVLGKKFGKKFGLSSRIAYKTEE